MPELDERGLRELREDEKLEIGTLLFERFLGPQAFLTQLGDGTVDEVFDPRSKATEWLTELGFERAEWLVNEDGDILLVLLWRYVEDPFGGKHLTDEFILEFAGHDAAIITVFNKGKDVSL